MPILAEDCPDCTPAETCCDSLFLVGDRIRTVAWEAVECCVTANCDKPFRTYTTFGNRIEDVLGDSLIVTLQQATNAPATTSTQGRVQPYALTRASFLLELRENGWPQSKVNSGKVIEVPDSDVIEAAAQHAMGHASAMWAGLMNAAASRNGSTRMFPLPYNHHVQQGGVAVGPLLPVGPQAYQAAWSVTVTVDFTMHIPTTGS